MSPTITFEQVTFRATKTVPCTVCGKTLRRQETFWNTLSPWNVNADGEPCTYEEARDKLRAKAAAWQDEPERHTKCEPVR